MNRIKKILPKIKKVIISMLLIAYMILMMLISLLISSQFKTNGFVIYSLITIFLCVTLVFPIIFHISLRQSLPEMFHKFSNLKNNIKKEKTKKKHKKRNKYKALKKKYALLKYKDQLKRFMIYVKSSSFTIPLALSAVSIFLAIYPSYSKSVSKETVDVTALAFESFVMIIVATSFIIEDFIIFKIKGEQQDKGLEKRYRNSYFKLLIKHKQCVNKAKCMKEKIRHMKKFNEHKRITLQQLRIRIYRYNLRSPFYRLFHTL